MGAWGSTARPGRFTRHPLYRRLGEPRDQSERMQKASPPPVFEPRTACSEQVYRLTIWRSYIRFLLSLLASRYPHLNPGRITAYPERLSWCRVSLISLLARYLGI